MSVQCCTDAFTSMTAIIVNRSDLTKVSACGTENVLLACGAEKHSSGFKAHMQLKGQIF